MAWEVKRHRAGPFLLLATLCLASCSQLQSQAMPKCSDESTLNLVRSILAEAGGEAKAEDALLAQLLSFDLVHSTKLEENIKRYSCEGQLSLADSSIQKLRLTFSTQLDDHGDQLVSVEGLTQDTVAMIGQAIRAKMSAAAPAAPVAAEPQAEVAATELEDVSQPAAAPLMENEEPAPSPAVRSETYDQYPAEMYRGEQTAPFFTGEQARFATYRTKIREAAAGGINFGGKYALAEIGCGSGCRFGYIIDAETGKIVELPFGGEEFYQLQLQYFPDSTMLFGRWLGDDFESCVFEAVVWDGSAFNSLGRKPFDKGTEACP